MFKIAELSADKLFRIFGKFLSLDFSGIVFSQDNSGHNYLKKHF